MIMLFGEKHALLFLTRMSIKILSYSMLLNIGYHVKVFYNVKVSGTHCIFYGEFFSNSEQDSGVPCQMKFVLRAFLLICTPTDVWLVLSTCTVLRLGSLNQ